MNDERSVDPPPNAEPAYRLAWTIEDDIFKARVEGDVDAQPVRLAYWREIMRTGRERGCRKLLVIDRKKGKPATPTELAELAHAFRDQRDVFERIAVVEPTAEFMPAVEHGEIFARSLGINVRIFADVASAERWVRFGGADD